MTIHQAASFPVTRLRRLRRSAGLRGLVRETSLAPEDLVLPLFIRHGQGIRRPISSMPGHAQLSVDVMVEEASRLAQRGLRGVILFGIPAEKDAVGSENFDPQGIVQQAIRALKEQLPDMIVMTDVCLCEYTDHGHCGILSHSLELTATENGHARSGGAAHAARQPSILNDETLEILGRVATSHAAAGADVVAPSAMMDGQVQAIRSALDTSGFHDIPVMAYAAKFASAFYGPFRDAAESPPSFGDRSPYQMDPANRREALRETELDAQEGADILMVKPALPYLDIIRDVRNEFSHPIAAYNVSGEYAMVKAAAERGWIDERRVTLETLTAIKRAGADIIITYHAPDALEWLAAE